MKEKMHKTKRANWPDIAFGIFLIGISALVLFETRGLRMGTTTEMKAGFVPKVLAAILGVSGIGIVVKNALKQQVRMEAIQLRPLLLISASFAAFALLLPTLGVVVSTFALTLLSMLADREVRKKELIFYPLVLAAFTTLVFAVGLRLPMPIWPKFF